MAKFSSGGSFSQDRLTNDSMPHNVKINTTAHVFTIQGGLHIDPSERRKLFANQLEEWAKGSNQFCIIRNYDRLYKDYMELHGELLSIVASLTTAKLNVWFDGKDYLVVYR